MTDRPARIRRILSVMMPVEATPNIHGYLWSKQIYCVLLYAQAVTDEAMADGTDAQARAALMRHVKEIEAGARARGLANLDELEDFRRSIHGETIGAPA